MEVVNQPLVGDTAVWILKVWLFFEKSFDISVGDDSVILLTLALMRLCRLRLLRNPCTRLRTTDGSIHENPRLWYRLMDLFMRTHFCGINWSIHSGESHPCGIDWLISSRDPTFVASIVTCWDCVNCDCKGVVVQGCVVLLVERDLVLHWWISIKRQTMIMVKP